MKVECAVTRLAVLHDYAGSPDQRLQEMVKQKIIAANHVMHAGEFTGRGGAADLEDLFDPAAYLEWFAKAYAKELKGAKPTLADLPAGDRIIGRIEGWLKSKGITLRPSGGFNHYLVALEFSKGAPTLDKATLDRFDAVFKRVNALFE